VPSLAGALQILTAYLADTAPSQKRLVIRYAFYSRLPFVAIALLPFLERVRAAPAAVRGAADSVGGAGVVRGTGVPWRG
jgi:hypothetical protein